MSDEPIGPPPPALATLRASLVRHLAVAAEEMAADRDPADPDAARAAAAAAWFRDQEDAAEPAGPGPVVVTEAGRESPLLDLLGLAWARHCRQTPGQGLDPDLLEAARQLLGELAWRMPDAGPPRG
jgi:hypothetical protein